MEDDEEGVAGVGRGRLVGRGVGGRRLGGEESPQTLKVTHNLIY